MLLQTKKLGSGFLAEKFSMLMMLFCANGLSKGLLGRWFFGSSPGRMTRARTAGHGSTAHRALCMELNAGKGIFFWGSTGHFAILPAVIKARQNGMGNEASVFHSGYEVLRGQWSPLSLHFLRSKLNVFLQEVPQTNASYQPPCRANRVKWKGLGYTGVQVFLI